MQVQLRDVQSVTGTGGAFAALRQDGLAIVRMYKSIVVIVFILLIKLIRIAIIEILIVLMMVIIGLFSLGPWAEGSGHPYVVCLGLQVLS